MLGLLYLIESYNEGCGKTVSHMLLPGQIPAELTLQASGSSSEVDSEDVEEGDMDKLVSDVKDEINQVDPVTLIPGRCIQCYLNRQTMILRFAI